MNKEGIILFSAIILGLAIIFCSIAVRDLSSVAELKIERDYDLALQPDSPADILNQNRLSRVEAANTGSASPIILATAVICLILFGFPVAFVVMTGRAEGVIKQWRLLTKKKQQPTRRYTPSAQTIEQPQRPLEGDSPLHLTRGQNWLDN